jgi:hypothetical protein
LLAAGVVVGLSYLGFRAKEAIEAIKGMAI